jgi:hypothetical protein
MYVHVPKALAVDPMAIDEPKYLIGFSNRCHRQIVQQLEHECTVRKAAAGDFAQDKGVDQYACVVEKIPKSCVAPAQVVDPNRGINEDQGFGG